MKNTNTNKKENPFALINKQNAEEAKEIAENKALETMENDLHTISEGQRIHAYLLAPYAVYKYSYQYTNTDGSISAKEKTSEKLFPLKKILNEDKQINFKIRLEVLQGALEKYWMSRATNIDVDKYRTETKEKLQKIYSILENIDEKIRYNANLFDLETVYSLSFVMGKLKSGHQLGAKKTTALTEFILYCLWSKLTGKGYTLGMQTQISEKQQEFERELEKLKKEIAPKKENNTSAPDEKQIKEDKIKKQIANKA